MCNVRCIWLTGDVQSDPYGSFWALITLFPVLALAVYLTVIVQRRDMVYLNALVGQVLCEYINGKLKKRIQQPRPTSTFTLRLTQTFWARATACLPRIHSFAASFVPFGRCIFCCIGPRPARVNYAVLGFHAWTKPICCSSPFCSRL